MDPYIDQRCREWAGQVRGGLGLHYSNPLADIANGGGDVSISDASWEIERIVAQCLVGPWRRVVKIHYLHPGCVTERVQRMRVSRKKYYSLLGEAHSVIRRELPEARFKAA